MVGKAGMLHDVITRMVPLYQPLIVCKKKNIKSQMLQNSITVQKKAKFYELNFHTKRSQIMKPCHIVYSDTQDE